MIISVLILFSGGQNYTYPTYPTTVDEHALALVGDVFFDMYGNLKAHLAYIRYV